VAELRARPALWKVDAKGEVEAWIEESRDLAKSFVYSREIIDAIDRPGDLQKINLPREYLGAAGEHARQRITAAGLRLGELLESDR
jgi:hypothetical protein